MNVRHANLKVRKATLEDAAALVEIYGHYVRESPATFETEVPSPADFRGRMQDVMRSFPWLVSETDDGRQITGYAYANTWKIRAAYRWSLEATVYVHPEFQRRGVGRLLYGELLPQLRAAGVYNLIAGITIPNDGSIGLHESFGFKPVARFPEVGFKMGRWWDVGYWQLSWPKPETPTEPDFSRIR